MFHVPGIYSITNLVNHKIYIGSSVDVGKRFWEHESFLRHNKHHSKHLQRAYNKYGKDNFKFDLITSCDKEKLEIFEQYYIDLFEATNINSGYNTSPAAGSTRGIKFTQEHRDKLSKAKKGKTPCWFLNETEEEKKEHLANFRKAAAKANSRPVYMIDIKTGIILKEFQSAREAEREDGYTSSAIAAVCGKKRKTHKGFMWEYKNK